MSEEMNSFDQATEQLDKAAEIIGLAPTLHKIFRKPKRVLEVAVPVLMDNGEHEVFTGYRVQHNINRGPAKGGIRYRPDVTLKEMKALAMLMTWKMRGGKYTLRRGKRRHRLRPETNEHERAGTSNATVHLRDPVHDRARAGYSCSGRLYRFANHGLDDGYLQYRGGPFSVGCGNGQAA